MNGFWCGVLSEVYGSVGGVGFDCWKKYDF